jgi:hypothetical protein
LRPSSPSRISTGCVYFGIVSAFEPGLEAEVNVDDTTWAIDHGPEDDDEYKKSTIRYWDGSIATATAAGRLSSFGQDGPRECD